MITKKRRKSSRHRATTTHGRGAMKKARGKGHKGGKGMAGSGKRADQKKSLALKIDKNYFGKSKIQGRKSSKKLDVINIGQILIQLPIFLKTKQANQEKDTIHVNLKGYKILSHTNIPLTKKLIINASAASKFAIEKVKKASGDITFPILNSKIKKKNS